MLWRALVNDLPRIGSAGSRSARLHSSPLVTAVAGSDLASERTFGGLRPREMLSFAVVRWVGTVGALLMGFGALGAGALPVVDNPYRAFPGGTLLIQLLQASSVTVLLGVALLVLAWVCMSRYVGADLGGVFGRPAHGRVSPGMLWRTAAAWVAPLVLTAPMFTQDIYSYLANGAIVRMGLDPYSAGPVDLLGTEHHLARSVPFIWAHSPSPYGPVALGMAAAVSRVTGDSVILGVLAHRLLGVLALAAAAWAVTRLARRCGISASTALWLGLLNPLTLLHLVGGIHNESVMLGFVLVGMEIGLRGVDRIAAHAGTAEHWRGLGLFALSGALISCGGMVKVVGFFGLGFTGMALARALAGRPSTDESGSREIDDAASGARARPGVRPAVLAVVMAAVLQVVILVATAAVVSVVTGIGLGWVTGQGGAATIRSWMSITTDVGVIAGFVGMLLDLGDHTDAMLSVTRAAGVLVSVGFSLRMLLATYRGTIHPVGGLGVSFFVLVIFFPVVHPWYVLWAVVPLAAWANRRFFRWAVVLYSAAFSFFVLPRGLALPPGTVLTIYVATVVTTLVVVALGWWALRKARFVGLD